MDSYFTFYWRGKENHGWSQEDFIAEELRAPGIKNIGVQFLFLGAIGWRREKKPGCRAVGSAGECWCAAGEQDHSMPLISSSTSWKDLWSGSRGFWGNWVFFFVCLFYSLPLVLQYLFSGWLLFVLWWFFLLHFLFLYLTDRAILHPVDVDGLWLPRSLRQPLSPKWLSSPVFGSTVS